MPEVLTETRPLNVVFEIGMERQRVAAERAQLERSVIEAAKKWREGVVGCNPALVIAVNALNDFESQQIKK